MHLKPLTAVKMITCERNGKIFENLDGYKYFVLLNFPRIEQVRFSLFQAELTQRALLIFVWELEHCTR